MTETVTQAVETPAPDANVTPVVESVAAPSPAAVETGEATEKPKGVQKRLDELTRNWRETERDRDHWRDLAIRNNSPQPKAEAPDDLDAPLKTEADFDFDTAKYQQYFIKETQRRAVEAAKRELSAEREREAGERRTASFNTRSTDFAKTVDDYDSVVRNPRLHITTDMAKVIEDSDDGPALAYHLGKNPDVADKLAQLSPITAARELGKIEARLAYEREKAKEIPKVSGAPPPPPKLEGSGDRVDKSLREMSQAEFEKARAKQIASRR